MRIEFLPNKPEVTKHLKPRQVASKQLDIETGGVQLILNNLKSNYNELIFNTTLIELNLTMHSTHFICS